MKQNLGTCSICGGRVVGYRDWSGTDLPPPPECVECGAVARHRGPVIPMQRPERILSPLGTFSRPITTGADESNWFIVSRMDTGDVS